MLSGAFERADDADGAVQKRGLADEQDGAAVADRRDLYLFNRGLERRDDVARLDVVERHYLYYDGLARATLRSLLTTEPVVTAPPEAGVTFE